ncbi:hypothetical protein ACFPPA_10770 [Rhodanobacter ginsengisoli]|uniref:Uncharacterized protein n=1 Tax=Rhodanobacter ginsengisoli TaxID=418646 RepID=A0ABW0QPD8_9GAMM
MIHIAMQEALNGRIVDWLVDWLEKATDGACLVAPISRALPKSRLWTVCVSELARRSVVLFSSENRL